jgi:hypothetical protein
LLSDLEALLELKVEDGVILLEGMPSVQEVFVMQYSSEKVLSWKLESRTEELLLLARMDELELTNLTTWTLELSVNSTIMDAGLEKCTKPLTNLTTWTLELSVNSTIMDAGLEKSRLQSTIAHALPAASSPCSRQPSAESPLRSQHFEKSVALNSAGVSEVMTWPAWAATAGFREHQELPCAECKPFSPTGNEAGQHSVFVQQSRFPRCLLETKPEANAGRLHVSDHADTSVLTGGDSMRSTPRGNAAGDFSRGATRGRRHNDEAAAGCIATCISPGDVSFPPPPEQQGKANGVGSQPSKYIQKLAALRSPEVRFHNGLTMRRSESVPPMHADCNPLTPEGRETLRASHKRIFPSPISSPIARFDGSSCLAQFVQPPSPNPPPTVVTAPVPGVDEIGCRGMSVQERVEAPSDLQAKQKKLNEKRQQLLRGKEAWTLIQNEGYHQAVAEMHERKVQDARYAEACRATSAIMKEKLEKAQEVKQRCHPSVANIAEHLRWDDH